MWPCSPVCAHTSAHTAHVCLFLSAHLCIHRPPLPCVPRTGRGQHTPSCAHMLAPVPATWGTDSRPTCGWPDTPAQGRTGRWSARQLPRGPWRPVLGWGGTALLTPVPPRLSPAVVTATLAETGLVSQGILLLLASRLLFVAISVYYYYQVGRKPKKV